MSCERGRVGEGLTALSTDVRSLSSAERAKEMGVSRTIRVMKERVDALDSSVNRQGRSLDERLSASSVNADERSRREPKDVTISPPWSPEIGSIGGKKEDAPFVGVDSGVTEEIASTGKGLWATCPVADVRFWLGGAGWVLWVVVLLLDVVHLIVVVVVFSVVELFLLVLILLVVIFFILV